MFFHHSLPLGMAKPYGTPSLRDKYGKKDTLENYIRGQAEDTEDLARPEGRNQNPNF